MLAGLLLYMHHLQKALFADFVACTDRLHESETVLTIVRDNPSSGVCLSERETHAKTTDLHPARAPL